MPHSHTAPDPFRVVAIISAYNEGDIISQVLRHLIQNGIEVYLIDNRSTDDTVEQAKPWLGRGLLDIESFPVEATPSGSQHQIFNWTAILRRKVQISNTLAADWFIHHDADEIRESPWPGLSLKEAIRCVDTLGFNCIDFRSINFYPTDNGFRQGTDPSTYFKYYEEAAEYDALQRKCWKCTGARVSLVSSGGHDVRFRGRCIFPIRFLLRHYPIRSQQHGVKKVFRERKNRFRRNERKRGWHVQYDRFHDESHVFLAEPSTLRLFDLDRIRLELMLDNSAAKEAAQRMEAAVADGERALSECEARALEFQQRISALEAQTHALEELIVQREAAQAALRDDADRERRERQELQARAAQAEILGASLRAREAELAGIRDSLAWRFVLLLWRVRRVVAPSGGRRDRTLSRCLLQVRRFLLRGVTNS